MLKIVKEHATAELPFQSMGQISAILGPHQLRAQPQDKATSNGLESWPHTLWSSNAMQLVSISTIWLHVPLYVI